MKPSNEAASHRAVYGALLANMAIAVMKFTAAAFTGSSAMWSEGIHSSIDTGNQILMLIGMKRSHQPADAAHPFGHGKELYFWNLLVGVLIFGVGGGISAYEGVLHVRHPLPMEGVRWNYITLAFAFLFEGSSLVVAVRAFISKHGGGNLITNIIDSKDPTSYTVIAEDSAALCGISIAAAGIFFSGHLRMPALDGVASILIGLLLAGVATFLIRECRGLLVGEGVDPQVARRISEVAGKDPLVKSVARPLTMYLGPENVLLTLDVTFVPDASATQVAASTQHIKDQIRSKFPEVKRIYVEAVEASTG